MKKTSYTVRMPRGGRHIGIVDPDPVQVEVVGELLKTGGLAVRREGPSQWTLDHTYSGMVIATLSSKKLCIQLAESLSDVDWAFSAVPDAMYVHAYSKIRAAIDAAILSIQ